MAMSHPARGAWIEICSTQAEQHAEYRRTPHGVRGLKYMNLGSEGHLVAVAPRTGCVD